MEQAATPPPPPPPPPPAPAPAQTDDYPVEFSVDYPDHDLSRLTTFFRFFVGIPILIVLGLVSGATYSTGTSDSSTTFAAAGGFLIAAPAVMILFREKYPRWWFDWNIELYRFSLRVWTYWFALMTDRYPSTDEQQHVKLEIPYPNVQQDLTRWMPLVKWFLAIPHYFVLFFLYIGVFFAIIFAWFAILFTATYPRGIFDFVEGVYRWHIRVAAYAFLLSTDKYPPFRLSP